MRKWPKKSFSQTLRNKTSFFSPRSRSARAGAASKRRSPRLLRRPSSKLRKYRSDHFVLIATMPASGGSGRACAGKPRRRADDFLALLVENDVTWLRRGRQSGARQ